MNDSVKCQFDLFEILKAHSRTSSSGVLSVKWDSVDLSLIINEGKIVGVDTLDNRLSVLVLERVARKLSLAEHEIEIYPDTNIFSKSAQSALSQKAGVLPHEIENIQRDVESEELHKLLSFKEGDFEFQLTLPDSSRNFVINISPGQFILDLVQLGFSIAIPAVVEPEAEEVIIEVKQQIEQPKVTEKKSPNTKSLERNWVEGEKGSILTYIRMLNYHTLTPEGVKLVYLVSGVFFTLFCGWRVPALFSSLVEALVALVKV